MKNFILNNKNIVIITLLILGVLFLIIKCGNNIHESELKKITKEKDILRKEIIKKDSLEKINDSVYRKLVNDYETQKSLLDKTEKISKDLAKKIKDNKENIKIVVETGFTFKPQENKNKAIEISDSIINIKSQYPLTNPFIKYDANINLLNKNIIEKWDFNEIPLNLIITEKQNGLWESYIVGNENMIVKKLTVNTLPLVTKPKEKENFINYYGGLGVIKIKDKTDITLNAGLTIGKKVMVTGLIVPLEIGSKNNLVGGGILYKF